MSSILTNVSALTALQNLNATQQNLSKVQGQISTGLKVQSAADNASYWSMSTQMQSDNGVLAAVHSSLTQNSALLQASTTALNTVIGTIGNIKAALAAAKGSGDFGTVNATLAQEGASLADAITGASINGQNLLDGSAWKGKLVSGFQQGTTGGATVDSIALSTQMVFQKSSTTPPTTSAAGPTVVNNATAGSAFQTIDNAIDNHTATLALGLDVITVTPTSGTTPKSVQIDHLAQDGTKTSTLYTATATSGTYNYNSVVSTTPPAGANGAGTGSLLIGTSSSAAGFKVDLTTLGSTLGGGAIGGGPAGWSGTIDDTNVDAVLNAVDNSLKTISSYAATLGATQARVDTQATFIAALQNSVTTSVSSLVDADMNQASARLSALQTQQQLGVQSLSIANQSSQMILKLFQ